MLSKISLLSYLKNEQVLNDYWYDCLRYELDKHIYYYGNHFRRSLEAVQESKIEKTKYIFKKVISKIKTNVSLKSIDKTKPVIISNAYFNFNEELSKLGFTVIRPPWTTDRNEWGYYHTEIVNLCVTIRSFFEQADFNYLISREFIHILEKFSSLFKKFIIEQNVRALVVPNDESFFENISIKIFEEFNLPTFNFLHGLPTLYNSIDENRTNYLIVWGERIKEMYVASGMEESKILVSGHPKYQKIIEKPIKFSLNNILVLTKTIPGSPHSNGVILSDRGNLIVYLISIQKVLQKSGVKSVRLRPHPSENINWYMKFLDRNFFIPDTKNLSDSLKATSLVIGPVSSVFLEAVYYQINYLVYEPVINKKNILNRNIPKPFDGSDNRMAVANDEETLFRFLSEQKCVDPHLLTDYYKTPFDVSFMMHLIK